MSIVQYAELVGEKILLTGDAGVKALEVAHSYAINLGISLPGLNRFQVPHHGSRRNLSTEILDKWLGAKLLDKPIQPLFWTAISASKNDEDHPRKAVIRALVHRGAGVVTTKGKTAHGWNKNKPTRPGWSSSIPEEYPDDTEADE